MGRKAGNTAVVDPPKNIPASVDNPVSMLATKGKPCPKLSAADFWRATKAYPRGAGVCYKLYRLFPVIDRRLTGETKKDIANRPEMDEQWILEHHGSGHYQVYFNDSNGRPVSLAECTLELDKDFWEHPPVLDQRELIEGHPKNKGYLDGLKARGLWKKDELQTEANSMATAEANAAATTAVQELSGIAKSAMAKANEKQPADAAVGQVVEMLGTAYKSALSTIGDTAGQKSGGGDLMVVVKLMQDQAQRQHEVFMELLKQQQNGRQNPAPAASIDTQISVVNKLMEFARSLGGGQSTSIWDRLPDLAMPLIAGMMQRAAAPAAPPQQPQQYASAPAYSSLPVAPGAPVAPPPVPAVAPPVAAAPSAEDFDAMMPMILSSMGLPVEAAPFVRSLAKIAAPAVQMFRAGMSGYAFAAEVERREGEEVYGMIYSAGRDEIVGLLGRLGPLLGAETAALVSSAPFLAWLADFFSYGKQAGYTDDVESDSEPAAGDAGAAE